MFKIFDCHCDTLTKTLWSNQSLYKNKLHIDIERLSNFERAVQLFAIWLDKPYLESAFENTMKTIDFFNSELSNYGDYISSDIQDENKVCGILTIEGGEAVEGSLEKLRLFYERGVRLITLTWNYKNEIGCGALSGFDEGLSDFGKKAVREMNSLNMLVDVSHLNIKGFFDVFRTSSKPFIATHSNAFSICSHPRNLNDDQLRAIAESKSFVGINLYPPFVDGDKGKLDNIMKHFDYVMNIVGEHNIGIGCDFDGIKICPEGINSVTDLKIIYNRICEIWGKGVADNIFFSNMYDFYKSNCM